MMIIIFFFAREKGLGNERSSLREGAKGQMKVRRGKWRGERREREKNKTSKVGEILFGKLNTKS